MRKYFQTLLLFLMVCLHLIELGQKGLQGLVGCSTLSIQVKTGTILNRNYMDPNPHYASIPLGDSRDQPTVLFLGIKNKNGVYEKIDFNSVINYTSGWYVLVSDRDKYFSGRNYQVKFVP